MKLVSGPTLIFKPFARGFKGRLVWPVPLAQVLPRSQLIFPFKTWFFGIYLNFQGQKSLKNQYLPHFEPKSYQMNSIKILLIKIFPRTPKAHSNSFEIFRYHFNLIFSEEIIQYSKTFASQVQTSWNQANAPLPLKSYPKRPRTQYEASWFAGSHKHKTNKQKTLLHR